MNIKFLRLAASGLLAAGTAGGIFALDAVAPIQLLSFSHFGQSNAHQALAQDAEDNVNVRVYQQVSPAVVSIDAGSGTGSGSIITPDGLILTNAHVLQDVQTVTVTLADGREVQGNVVAFGESGEDLAAVQLQGQSNLPTVRLASPSSVSVGQRAFAIGNPFGRFRGTFTTGIVSRIDASRGLIQTDAAINPGNSGGPLLNSQGELIGVNSAIFTTGRDSGNIGIGFAISVDRVQPFLVAVREGRAPRTAQTPRFDQNAQRVALNSAPVNGSLTDSSNVLPADDSYFNPYSFEGRMGQQVMIEMTSSDLDAYLILLDPSGAPVAQDDDSGGGTNSRVIATLPTNGTYTILANSYSAGETGSYNLRVATTGAASSSPTTSSPSPAPSSPSPTPSIPSPTPSIPSPVPSPLSPSGRVILQEQGVLGSDSQVLESDGSLYEEHRFEGRQGQQLTISMESGDFDTYLILVDPSGQMLEQNDDVCSDNSPQCTNSQITVTLPTDGAYTVFANAYDNSGRGRYTLTVR
jgi:S1-C subfamily serine protease